jgi:hypothetical protein
MQHTAHIPFSKRGHVMSKLAKFVCIFCLFLLYVGVAALQAIWVEDGILVCSANYDQYYPRIISDGDCGAIIVWMDGRNVGYTDIYVQRLDGMGNSLWTTDGVAVCMAAEEQHYPEIDSDGMGGVVIAWQDYRSSIYWDIYAQRVDEYGSVLWTTDGVDVCSAANHQYYPKIISDGTGGAIITWQDYRNGSTYDIYAQRVDAYGTVQWTVNGVPICTAAGHQVDHQITSDGTGGAIITWADRRSGNYDIYAQRINAGGIPQWTPDGVEVCIAANDSRDPDIIPDGAGGAIITWRDSRMGDDDIYAQRIDASGNSLWTIDGIAICTAIISQDKPCLVSDSAGGAIITWHDYRNAIDTDIYAQRVSAGGSIMWAADGIAVCTAPYDQDDPQLTSDGAGSAIITWGDDRNGIDSDIYAQRVDASGTLLWNTIGVAVCTKTNEQWYPYIASDGAGSAFITWQSHNGANWDVYAQLVDKKEGRYDHHPAAIFDVRDVPGDQGGMVYLSWYSSRLERFQPDTMSYYSVWRAISPSSAMLGMESDVTILSDISDLRPDTPGRVIRTELRGGMTYFWEQVGTQQPFYLDAYGMPLPTLFDSSAVTTEYHYFQVITHTTEPTVFYISEVDSGYSVDNLAPAMPMALAGDQSITPAGLELTWDPNSEPDLAGYRVYRGLTDDFTPGPGNLLDSPSDTTTFDDGWTWDSGYYYKVSAVDIHGNESPHALLGPDEITGDDPPPVPLADYLSQNFPNPFNPVTRISFGLKEPGHVTLRIYDVSGKLIRVLVDERREAGRYTETWDGLDNKRVTVSSGVYFYSLISGSLRDTRKMVLMR